LERVLRIITLDIKRKKLIKGLMILLFIITGILFSNYFLLHSIGMCEINEVPSMLLHIIPFVTLVISSFSLTQEFSNKTDKMIFTGIFNRNEIVISKLMGFIITSIVFFVFYGVTCIVCNTFNVNILINDLWVFLLYAFTIGSFILLVSAITSNFIITGIVGYVLYFDLTLVLLNQALASKKNQVLKQVIRKLPFYIANTGFYGGNYTTEQSIIMISFGVLFLGTACVIINRKNM